MVIYIPKAYNNYIQSWELIIFHAPKNNKLKKIHN